MEINFKYENEYDNFIKCANDKTPNKDMRVKMEEHRRLKEGGMRMEKRIEQVENLHALQRCSMFEYKYHKGELSNIEKKKLRRMISGHFFDYIDKYKDQENYFLYDINFCETEIIMEYPMIEFKMTAKIGYFHK